MTFLDCGGRRPYGDPFCKKNFKNTKETFNQLLKDIKKNTKIIFKNHFSSGRYFTWTRSNDMWSVGCFYGTGEELIQKAYADSERKGKFYEAYVNFVERLKQIEDETTQD